LIPTVYQFKLKAIKYVNGSPIRKEKKIKLFSAASPLSKGFKIPIRGF